MKLSWDLRRNICVLLLQLNLSEIFIFKIYIYIYIYIYSERIYCVDHMIPKIARENSKK